MKIPIRYLVIPVLAIAGLTVRLPSSSLVTAAKIICAIYLLLWFRFISLRMYVAYRYTWITVNKTPGLSQENLDLIRNKVLHANPDPWYTSGEKMVFFVPTTDLVFLQQAIQTLKLIPGVKDANYSLPSQRIVPSQPTK
ncbi:hypothetical protein A3B57_01905 [Microgenomates group bacterium RIFCSPLOWO2_01_FULL_47_10]|nr:MAG: hypothetical protein A3B57_01905 [Microgenomates group bacterium RIFCSPLOWO2_01_FULL_47_10]